jgi:hypothetical protein
MSDEPLGDKPKNWRCPDCGHSRIVIIARTCARVYVRDGDLRRVDADESEPYWYASDWAECDCFDSGEEDCECEWGCGGDGTVAELKVVG